MYKLAETLNNFEFHHLQNNFYDENNLNQTLHALTLIWVGFLEVRFEVGGRVKLPLPLSKTR